MNKFFLFIIFTTLFLSCAKSKKDERNLEIIVRAFSSKLYVNYHLFSDPERKDNVGKFKGTWPKTMKVDDPHSKALKRRKMKKNKL